MDEFRRHQMVFKVLMPFIHILTKWKFNYEYDSLKDIEGPYLLLANHNLELDPVLVGEASKEQIYFVASEHLLRKGIASKLLMHFIKPIIHMKGRQGAKTVKQMLRALQDGHRVCIFPEGNRSFNGVTMDMEASIAKVAKKAKAKLITYRLEGGYFTQPRWGTNIRRGKMRGRLVHIYTPEEMATMSDEQLNDAIIADLHEDAYETQKRERIAFKGSNLALGMESTLFACPECGKIGTTHSEKNQFFCECGFSAAYDVYGMLTDKNGKTYTITELDQKQREALKEKVQSADENTVLFEDKVTVYRIGTDHELISTEQGMMKAYTDRLQCEGDIFDFKDMDGLAIYSRNAMILHHESLKGHLEMKSDIGFSALKYLYLYEIAKEIQKSKVE